MAVITGSTAGRKARWTFIDIVVVVYALVPVLWTLSLSFKTVEAQTDKKFFPSEWTFQNYKDIFTTNEFIRALINSIGIALISTLIAVVLGTMAAYAIARLDFPGKQALVGVSLLIAMFPQVSLVSPLFEMERNLGLFDTWTGLILPVHHLRAAAGDLHAVGVLPGDPVGAREGGEDGRGDAGAGVPPGDRAAGRAGRVHHRDPGVHLLLERLPVRHLADLDRRRRGRCRRRCRSSPVPRSSRRRPGRSPRPPW